MTLKGIVSLLASVAMCAGMPDFWQSKPFTDWSPKEIRSLESASPWSKQFWVSIGAPSGEYGNSVLFTVSWRSALPLRQVLARERFANQAATSPEARKLIGEEPEFYEVLVTLVPGTPIFKRGVRTEQLLANTSLAVKGKARIRAAEVQTGGNEKKAFVLFLFSRTYPISQGDGYVEFSNRIGPYLAAQKFRLKDMIFNGRLEM